MNLDDTLEQTSSNTDVASEGAFLVNISAVDGSGRGLEAQTNVLVVAQRLALSRLGTQNTGSALGDSGLLLECALDLIIFISMRHSIDRIERKRKRTCSVNSAISKS